MLRKLLLLPISFSFLTACAHTPGGISASNTPLEANSYTILEDALVQAPGTDALIQLTSDSYSQYWILWSNSCTQVRGTAVKNNI